jgi:hypothetical protein
MDSNGAMFVQGPSPVDPTIYQGTVVTELWEGLGNGMKRAVIVSG